MQNPVIMSNVDYHAASAVSKSDLDLIAKSPAHYIESKNSPKEQTASMLLGSVAHKLVLEPDKFEEEFAIAPDVDRRTKAGKEQWAEFAKGITDKITVIDNSTFEQSMEIAKAVGSHPIASKLLHGGQAELSYFWVQNGIECKCRPDYLRTDIKMVVDFKTAQDASPDEFAKAAYKYRYHVQTAWYLDGLRACGLDIENFIFVVCETKPPYNIMVYAADVYMINLGRAEAKENLETYGRCLNSDVWHGYEQTPKINSLSLPDWVLRRINL